MTENADINLPEWAVPLSGFDGNASELSERLTELMPTFGWATDDTEPSVRLIRFYTQEGGLDRPERRGKEAYYGFRQLVQFVALRWLLNDGWPLAKAAVETSTRDNAELLALVPAARPERRAAELVRRFQSDMPLASRPIADAIVSSQLELSGRVGRMSRARAALGIAGAPSEPRDALRLDLADWCAVVVDADALANLTDEQARALGDALGDALIDARVARLSRKKRL